MFGVYEAKWHKKLLMTYYCNKICRDFRGKGKFKKGNKRCDICKIYVKFKGFSCPCCGHRLQSRPKNKNRKIVHDKKTGLDKRRI